MDGTNSLAGPDERSTRAASALNVAETELIDAVCRFTAIASPSGPLAVHLATQLLTRLNLIPVGSLATAHDLSDAAIDTDASRRHIPPIPGSLPGAIAYLDVALSRLSPAELCSAAQQLSLPRGVADLACKLITPRESAPLYTVIRDDDPEEEARGARYRANIAATMTALTGNDPQEWGQRELAVLRLALRLHLARFGDGYLRVSEWSTTPLIWERPSPDQLTTTYPVTAAPRPLEASVEPDHRFPNSTTRTSELFAPHRPVPAEVFMWRIGWRDDADEFQSYVSGRESTTAAARFAVEAAIDELSEQSGHLRGPTGDVFVPYTPAAVLVGDLPPILRAVFSELRPGWNVTVEGFGPGRGESRACHNDTDPEWPMSPHRRPDEPVASLVAAVFDHLELPWPHLNDPACVAAVDSPEFDEFLARQSVVLTGPARTYLAGMTDAGPGAQPLSTRHASGFTALLNSGPEIIGAMQSELPAPSFGYDLMVDIEMLALYFDENP